MVELVVQKVIAHFCLLQTIANQWLAESGGSDTCVLCKRGAQDFKFRSTVAVSLCFHRLWICLEWIFSFFSLFMLFEWRFFEEVLNKREEVFVWLTLFVHLFCDLKQLLDLALMCHPENSSILPGSIERSDNIRRQTTGEEEWHICDPQNENGSATLKKRLVFQIGWSIHCTLIWNWVAVAGNTWIWMNARAHRCTWCFCRKC